MTKYDVSRQFRAGAAAGITNTPLDDGKGPHWRAGWVWAKSDLIRSLRASATNEHLADLGMDPIGEVHVSAVAAHRSESEAAINRLCAAKGMDN